MWRLGGRRIGSERRRSSRRRRSRGPESTRSSSKHVRKKKGLSKVWSTPYLMTRGSFWSWGFPSNGRCSWPKSDRTIGSPSYLIKSDGDKVSWKNSTIAVRSNRDRGAIEPRSWNFRHGLKAMFAAHDSERKRPRSKLEILTIVVRSLLDRDHDQARSWHLLEQKLSEIHGESWSYDVAPRNRSHDPCKPPPRPLPWPRLSGQFFSLKPMYSPSMFFNFWSTREEIKRVSRKVLSSRDPLLPRV